MNMRRSLVYLVVLFALLVSACTAAPAGNGSIPDTAGTPGAVPDLSTIEQSPAVVAAKQALSEQLGIDVDQIQFDFANVMQWNDACLDLPNADEVCAQMVTPGFVVLLTANGQQYELHADEMGANVRIKP